MLAEGLRWQPAVPTSLSLPNSRQRGQPAKRQGVTFASTFVREKAIEQKKKRDLIRSSALLSAFMKLQLAVCKGAMERTDAAGCARQQSVSLESTLQDNTV